MLSGSSFSKKCVSWNSGQNANVDYSVEVDDMGIEDTDVDTGTGVDLGTGTLSDGFTQTFKGPDNADGTRSTLKE